MALSQQRNLDFSLMRPDLSRYDINQKSLLIDSSDPQVFEPHPITIALAKNISVDEKSIVLDLCTGSGLLAIMAASLNSKFVVASDISQRAIKNAMLNARLNMVSNKIQFVLGDLLTYVKKSSFDLLIVNPPCMPCPPNTIFRNPSFTHAVNGGFDGTIYYEKVLKDAISLLKRNGKLLIPIPMWSNCKNILELVNSQYEGKIREALLVKYYLAEDNNLFYKHIEKLIQQGIVNGIKFVDGYYFEVLIFEGHPK